MGRARRGLGYRATSERHRHEQAEATPMRRRREHPPLPTIEGIVERALAWIKPQPEKRAPCSDTMQARVKMLRELSYAFNKLPSPGELKEDLQCIQKQLKNTSETIRQYPAASGLIFSATPSQITPADPETGFSATRPPFLDQLDELIDAAEFSRG